MSRVWGWMSVSSLALRLVLFAVVAVCAQFAGPAWAGVIYVRGDAAGTKTGLSWADAYTDLQAALAAAASGDEIWVAQGTYKPTTGTLRTVSFVLKEGVGLYGGLAGTETERSQRNWETNVTILSGDIGTAGSIGDNSYHVVVGANLAILDGFTITGGNGWEGGGMYNRNASPAVTNCTFSRNGASTYGGGMHNWYCSPSVTYCMFIGNWAGDLGGGMQNYGASPTVTNCTFTENKANYRGGGISNDYSGSPSVINCTFSGNGGQFGGGMHNSKTSPIVINCTFNENTASQYGAGMLNSESADVITGCTFTGNAAGIFGGGMSNHNCSPIVTGCVFSGNTAGGVMGSGMGGGMGSLVSSATVDNCTFSRNTVGYRGGGMASWGSSLTLTNCTFSGNTAVIGGGGTHDQQSSPTLINCIFWDNTAPLGAEICNTSATLTLRYCNIKGSGGSGTLWDPALGVDGGGNIGTDPRFVAPAVPAGPDGLWRTRDDGLRLRSDSPCIGTADPAVAPKTDILGLPRKIAPDIGAYEYYPIVPASVDPAWVLFR